MGRDLPRARPFKWKRGRLLARLSTNERLLLMIVVEDLTQLLSERAPDFDVPEWARDLGLAGVGAPRTEPEDPVLQRLLPAAYEDEQQAAEFRRLTEAGLRATKLANLRAVRGGLDAPGHIDLTDDVRAWLSVMADARLAIGTRLGVTEDDSMAPSMDPVRNNYLYLAWLQQSLVEALMGE